MILLVSTPIRLATWMILGVARMAAEAGLVDQHHQGHHQHRRRTPG